MERKRDPAEAFAEDSPTSKLGVPNGQLQQQPLLDSDSTGSRVGSSYPSVARGICPSHKKPRTEKRKIVCVLGVMIDEHDYGILQKIFPELTTFQPTHNMLTYQATKVFQINGREEGHRVCKLAAYKAPIERENLPELIAELDALKEYTDGYDEKTSYDVGKWTNLEKLCLPNRGIVKLSSSIGNLINLKRLDLSGNRHLESLPDEIRSLTKLEELTINETQMESPPDFMCILRSLKKIDLSWNRNLRSLPDEIMELTKLEVLSLQGSSLFSIPESVCSLTSLKILDLSYNSQLWSLPDELAGLINLEKLCLGRTGVASIPHSIRALTKLKTLDLSWNTRMMSLPISICNLTNLVQLDIGIPNFRGLPEEFARLINLEELCLAFTKIEELPNSVCNLTNLKKLNLTDMRHLQSLPDGIGRLTQLQELSIMGTKVSSLPSSIGNLRNLEKLRIHFLSELPIEFGKLKNLNALIMNEFPSWESQDLSKIDAVLGKLQNLRALFVPYCMRRSEKLLNLVHQCPSLECLGANVSCGEDSKHLKDLVYSLFQNRVRSQLADSLKFPPSLWPFILRNTKIGRCRAHDTDLAEFGISQSDIIFHVLVGLRGIEQILSERDCRSHPPFHSDLD